MDDRLLVSIACPFYNESGMVDKFYTDLIAELDRLSDYQFEVVCIDDGSQDNTLAELLANTQFDLKKPLRQGYLDRDLAEVFFKTARFKQRGHHLAQSHPSKVIGQMSAIGG